MIVFMSSLFRKIYFFKPNQNPWSQEFYIICIDYIKPINDKQYNKLADFVDNFDINKQIIDLNNIDDDIKYPILNAFNEIINKHIYDMKRSFYYIDNYHYITDDDWNKIDKKINEKNYEWMRTFKIKYINDQDKLI